MRHPSLSFASRLRPAFLRVLHAAAVVCAGLWVARAAPTGVAPPTLSYSGTLRSEDGRAIRGPVQLRFQFVQNGVVACSSLVDVDPDESDGAFDALVPITDCSSNLFEGSETTFDVFAGDVEILHRAPIGAVPYANYADAVGTPLCPDGYTRSERETAHVVCTRGDDEIVRVGTGATAFWIDRFESGIESRSDGTGERYGVSDADDYPANFPDDGQYTVPLYALSRRGKIPSTYASWLQARSACEASGKRLPTLDEWFEAARATPDPPTPSDGSGNSCVTRAVARRAGLGLNCASAWGAEDLVGNLYEWTAEWLAGVGDGTSSSQPWPSNDDATWNLVSSAATGLLPGGDYRQGLPSALRHGGTVLYGTAAGVFSFDPAISPVMAWALPGVRCVTPR